MKRAWWVVAVSLLLAGGAAPALAQESGTSIREIDLKAFPRIELVVSTGSVEADPGDLVLEEDGATVASARVAPVGEDQAVDVALVLDTSGSMEGVPLASAIDAAATFVKDLPAQIRVAIVTFSDAPALAQRFTNNKAALLSTIAGVQAAGETALFDAVVQASGLFSSNAQRNIIVLSDGADTASRAGLKAATAAARKSGAAVFTIGLRSGEFDAGALRALARVNQGSYATADTSGLSAIYEGLAAGLKNQFLVSYRSDVAPGERLSVAVEGPNGTDSVLVLAPKTELPSETEAEPAPVRPAPVADPVLSGTTGLIVVVGLVFGSLFLLFVVVGQSAAHGKRDKSLARRFGAAEPEEEEEHGAAWLPEALIDATERLTAKTRLGVSLEQRLELAGTPLKPGEFVAASVLALVAGAMVGQLLFSNLLLSFALAVIAGSLPHLLISVKQSRRQKNIQAQLADVLSVMASSLRAGHSFLQSLNMVAQQVPEPGAGEFARVVAEVRLGKPIDEALESLAERIGSADFRWAVMAVNIQREAGGNLAEVFDTVATTLRERDVLRRQVDVLSAEGRMSMIILTLLPVALALYLLMVNPDYLSLLWTTRIGMVMLAVGGGLLALGQIWMKRVVKIDV